MNQYRGRVSSFSFPASLLPLGAVVGAPHVAPTLTQHLIRPSYHLMVSQEYVEPSTQVHSARHASPPSRVSSVSHVQMPSLLRPFLCVTILRNLCTGSRCGASQGPAVRLANPNPTVVIAPATIPCKHKNRPISWGDVLYHIDTRHAASFTDMAVLSKLFNHAC